MPQHQKDLGLKVRQSNLCSEIMLHTGKDHLGKERTAVCCLSSVNAETFLEWRDEPRFVEDVMRFLDNVLQDFIERAPEPAAAAVYAATRERSVGLGLMGFHSFLQAQGVPFESALAKSWNMRLFKHLRREADKASVALAEEKGACPDAAERGVMERFSHKLAIAPTASISIICGGTSAGIEPIPANIYTHKTLSGSFAVKNPYLERLLEQKGINTEAVWNTILEKEGSVQHIDELDEDDNVYLRMDAVKDFAQPNAAKIRPEMEWLADGTVLLTFCFPAEKKIAEAAAIECAKRMNLKDIAVISREVLHRAEGTRIELKGKVDFDIDIASLVIQPEPDVLSEEELRAAIEQKPMRVVCGTIGEDEHSVGLREIIDIKHGGIEKYGIEVHYLGTSVPPEKLVGAAIELNADAMLASVIISHDDIHYKNIARIDRIAREMGVREKLLFAAGGTQVDNDRAKEAGADAGFGRGTHGNHVATFLVKEREKRERE